jgi:hypothetical protein
VVFLIVGQLGIGVAILGDLSDLEGLTVGVGFGESVVYRRTIVVCSMTIMARSRGAPCRQPPDRSLALILEEDDRASKPTFICG